MQTPGAVLLISFNSRKRVGRHGAITFICHLKQHKFNVWSTSQAYIIENGHRSLGLHSYLECNLANFGSDIL